MEMIDEELKSHLMATDEEFRTLADAHQGYERQLNDLESKGLVTPGEELEEHHIKKLKLACKDQMLEIMARYRLQEA